MIYFILGISGSGKSTLISNIKKLNLPNLEHPLSYKTREKRDFEVD
jgi:guanylate kinase